MPRIFKVGGYLVYFWSNEKVYHFFSTKLPGFIGSC